jgi:hypothetical protein
MDAPNGGATRYIQTSRIEPLNTAGASERAGVIEAPEMGPANKASKAMTPPISTPANTPFSFALVATPRIMNMSMAVSTASG